MNLVCLYYVARGYKAIYHLKPQIRSFDAAGCLKSDGYYKPHTTIRTFSFNETDRRSKLNLINFETVETK